MSRRRGIEIPKGWGADTDGKVSKVILYFVFAFNNLI